VLSGPIAVAERQTVCCRRRCDLRRFGSFAVVRCSLFVVRCSLFVVRCSLFVVRCSFCIARCSLSSLRLSSFVVHCCRCDFRRFVRLPSFVVLCSLPFVVVRWPSFAVHRRCHRRSSSSSLKVVRCSSFVIVRCHRRFTHNSLCSSFIVVRCSSFNVVVVCRRHSCRLSLSSSLVLDNRPRRCNVSTYAHAIYDAVELRW